MNTKGKSTLENFIKILKLRNYADNSIKIYVHYVSELIESFDKPALHITSKDIKFYIENYNYTSISKQNQVYSSIKLFSKHVLNIRYLDKIILERPRKQKKLPRIINHQYLVSKLDSIKNIKHRAILSLAYSTGMRVSEVISLKINDIDSDQMLIGIINSKFNKDRYVKLTPKILGLLRLYYKEYKPYQYLFNGEKSLQYTASSCNKLVKKYLGNEYHMHLLRHSYATKSMENGTNLRLLQNQMGHSSSKTLERYSHVSTEYIQEVNTPL